MINANEGALRMVYASLLKQQTAFCACEQCQDDVIAWALNNTKPRYVSGNPPLGLIVTDVHLSYDQVKAELTVVLLDAMKKVAASPRHEPRSAPTETATR